jgi:hypothetical protein
MRGHAHKISRIVEALETAGELPPGLRPCELRRRIFDKALELGYHARELPSRSATDRWLERMGKSGKTDSVLNEAPA